MLIKLLVKVSWECVRVQALREDMGIDVYSAKTKEDRKVYTLANLFDYIDNTPVLKKAVHKWGSYIRPGALLTKYVANGIPMFTVLFQVLRCSRLQLDSYLKTIWEHSLDVYKADIIQITQAQAKKQKPTHQPKPAAQTTTPETKQEIIEMLKVGCTTREVADHYKITIPQASAYKAHITMGSYDTKD